MCNGFHDLVILDGEIPLIGICRIGFKPVFISVIFDTQHSLSLHIGGVNHERISGIQGVHFKRSLVGIHIERLIIQDHSVCGAGNHLPLHNLTVKCLLIDDEHVFIQCTNGFTHGCVISSTNVLNRFTTEITDLERYNLIGPVFHNLVADLRSHRLGTTQDRLVTLVILPQVINFTTVHIVDLHRLLQHFHHILRCNLIHVSGNDTPAIHGSRIHSEPPFLQNKKVHDCPNPNGSCNHAPDKYSIYTLNIISQIL